MKFSTVKWYEFALGLMLFLQVLLYKIIPIGIIVFVLVLIVEGVKKQLRFTFTTIHLFLVLFYLSYLVGVFSTQNMKEAMHVLESKMLFLIFPLLFLVIPKAKLTYTVPIWMFSGALVVQYLFGISKSILCYQSTHSLSCFTSSSFSTIHHPTYLAIYFLMGFATVIYAFRRKLTGFNFTRTLALCTLFFVGYIQCLSLSALLFLFLLIGVMGWCWSKKKFGVLKSVGAVAVLLIGFLLLINLSKDTVSDIKNTTKSFELFSASPHVFLKNSHRTLSGNEERLILWTVSTEAILAHPFGYGTGNIDLVIGGKLRSYGLYKLAEKNYNSHNQYLQTFIETGIVGFFILIGLFISIARKALQTKNLLLLLLVATFAFNALFESMFQRQSGIVFFVIMVCMLMHPTMVATKVEEKV